MALLPDHLKNSLQMGVHLVVREADDTASLSLKPLRARRVVLHLLDVRIAVQFHDQPAGRAVKVDHETAQRMLAAESEPELPVAQVCPQLALGWCLWLTQGSCASLLRGVNAVSSLGGHRPFLFPSPCAVLSAPSPPAWREVPGW